MQKEQQNFHAKLDESEAKQNQLVKDREEQKLAFMQKELNVKKTFLEKEKMYED